MKLSRNKLRQLIKEALKPVFWAAVPSNEIQQLIRDPKVTNQNLKQLLGHQNPDSQRQAIELFLTDIPGFLNMDEESAFSYMMQHYPSLYAQYRSYKLDVNSPADAIEKSSKEYQKHFDMHKKETDYLYEDDFYMPVTNKLYALEKSFEKFFARYQDELYDIASQYPKKNIQGEENFSIEVRLPPYWPRTLSKRHEGSATIKIFDKGILEKIKTAAETTGLVISRIHRSGPKQLSNQTGSGFPFFLTIFMPKNHPLITYVRERMAQTQA
tara:strand:+ start:16 stop:822 length:807 start_codon:yes stop_codon:yes gene_type:complete